MTFALELARKGLGTAAPNPSVGAVLVDAASGDVVGHGHTQPGGRPHAETEALAMAGPRARGTVAYVTLEPCSHFGRTPPCADALIAAGVGRLVVGIEDPDPRVAGRGLARVASAGIPVLRGVLAAEARHVTLGHILRVTERRPMVIVKLAVGADGRIAAGTAGRPVWVTGPEARASGHVLRAEADAILIGAGTLAADDPELTCRLPGLEHRSPLRVVLAGRRPLPSAARLLQPDPVPGVIVFSAARRELPPGVTGELVPEVAGRLWLPAVMERLAGLGMTRVLVEGGPGVWLQVARGGLADEAVLYHARAAPDVPVAAEAARDALMHYLPQPGLLLHERRELGADDMLVFRRRSAPPAIDQTEG